jgi:hypothetical protein
LVKYTAMTTIHVQHIGDKALLPQDEFEQLVNLARRHEGIAVRVQQDETTAMTFEAYLRTMPDVGTDADFSRIAGSLRDIDLAE